MGCWLGPSPIAQGACRRRWNFRVLGRSTCTSCSWSTFSTALMKLQNQWMLPLQPVYSLHIFSSLTLGFTMFQQCEPAHLTSQRGYRLENWVDWGVKMLRLLVPFFGLAAGSSCLKQTQWPRHLTKNHPIETSPKSGTHLSRSDLQISMKSP